MIRRVGAVSISRLSNIDSLGERSERSASPAAMFGSSPTRRLTVPEVGDGAQPSVRRHGHDETRLSSTMPCHCIVATCWLSEPTRLLSFLPLETAQHVAQAP